MAKKYVGATTVRALMEIIKGELSTQQQGFEALLNGILKSEDIVKDLATYVTPEGGDNKVVAAAVVKELSEVITALTTAGEDGDKSNVAVKFGDVLKTWEGYDVDADADKVVAAALVKAIKDQVDDLQTKVEDLSATVSDELAGQKGKPGGIASLDDTGKVPADQLPSYVDDVVEGFLYDVFRTETASDVEGAPATRTFYEPNEDGTAASATEIVGEKGKIYIDLATNYSYRWSGTTYVRVNEVDLVELTDEEVETIWNEIAAKHEAVEEGL